MPQQNGIENKLNNKKFRLEYFNILPKVFHISIESTNLLFPQNSQFTHVFGLAWLRCSNERILLSQINKFAFVLEALEKKNV